MGAVNFYLANLKQRFSTNISRAFPARVMLNSLASSDPEDLRSVVCLEQVFSGNVLAPMTTGIL